MIGLRDARVALAMKESEATFARVRRMKEGFPLPRAAKGRFPYRHRTVAEVDGKC